MTIPPRRSSTSPGPGTSPRSWSARAGARWQELLGGGSIVRKIARLAAPACIDVHIIARRDASLDAGVVVEAANES